MKPRDYCCCAIPTVNAGIYTVLTEQFVLGIVAGTLSIATPSIVGAATPSFAKWIFAIVCYVAAAIQVFGFLGVARESTILYRRYVTLHIMATVAAFSVAAAWVIISATRHSTAKTNCVNDFFVESGSSTPTASEAGTLCDIFPWVDVGLMGGLLAFFAAVHIYFYVVISAYGSGQRRDHRDYDSSFDAKPLANDIPLMNRSNAWDRRPSDDHLLNEAARPYDHQRSMSGHSVSTIIGEPIQQEAGGYGAYAGQYSTRQPVNAYTQDPGPTPQFSGDYYHGGSEAAAMNKPLPSQPHPAEGSFRRKTPRLTKPEPEASFDQSFFRGGG